MPLYAVTTGPLPGLRPKTCSTRGAGVRKLSKRHALDVEWIPVHELKTFCKSRSVVFSYITIASRKQDCSSRTSLGPCSRMEESYFDVANK